MPPLLGPQPKPPELCALYEVAGTLFAWIGDTFSVKSPYELDLSNVDAVAEVLERATDIAALTMRRLQALRLVATPGHLMGCYAVIGTCEQVMTQLTLLQQILDESIGPERFFASAMRQIGEAAMAVGGFDDDTNLI